VAAGLVFTVKALVELQEYPVQMWAQEAVQGLVEQPVLLVNQMLLTV
jgi:hypothetical protein